MTEYPTEETLTKIRIWDTSNWDSMLELLDLLKDEWYWKQYFRLKGKNVLRLELITGGWSGNESLIEALMGNEIFWQKYHVQTECIGLYYFKMRNKNLPTIEDVKGILK